MINDTKFPSKIVEPNEYLNENHYPLILASRVNTTVRLFKQGGKVKPIKSAELFSQFFVLLVKLFRGFLLIKLGD